MTKTILVAAVLALVPALSFAEGCMFGEHGSETAAMSCAEGTMMDADTQTCVPVTTG